jgi:hypothetical protein
MSTSRSTISLLVCVFIALTSRSAFAISAINLSGNSGVSRNAMIATNGAAVIAVWEDNTPGNFEIFMASSTDEGNSFGPPVNVSQTSGDSTCYDWAVIGGVLYFVWADGTDVFFRRLDTTPPVQNVKLKLGTRSSYQLVCPRVAVSGKNVYVAWMGATNFNLVLRRSEDGGLTFLSPVTLGSGLLSTLISFGPHVYVAWEFDPRLLLRRSQDGGATFGPTVVVLQADESGGGNGEIDSSRFTVDGLNVYVLAREHISLGGSDPMSCKTNTFRLLFTRSSDAGDTFEAPREFAGNAYPLPIHAASRSLQAFWIPRPCPESSTGLTGARSTDTGGTWTPMTLPLTSEVEILEAQVALSGISLHAVAAVRTGGNNEILYTRSRNSGETWKSPAINLSQTPGASRNPDVAALGSTIHVVWQESGIGNPDILYRRSTDGGF